MPCPVSDSKAAAACTSTPRSRAAATTADARGCSLACSTAPASASTPDSVNGGTATTPVTRGRPSVSVPVLSTTRVSTPSRRSSASAFLISTPAPAPRPVPTMMAIGVARPSAQGHAMISTATALTSPCASRGSGPHTLQAANAISAMTATAGTNQAATRSASR